MKKLERFVLKFIMAVKYFSILCLGSGATLIIKYGFNLDFILLIALSTMLLCCAVVALKEADETAEF